MCSFTTPETKGSKEAVVLTHGYGAGLAFFYRNLQDMAEASGERWLQVRIDCTPANVVFLELPCPI
jgi:hypothetical protein